MPSHHNFLFLVSFFLLFVNQSRGINRVEDDQNPSIHPHRPPDDAFRHWRIYIRHYTQQHSSTFSIPVVNRSVAAGRDHNTLRVPLFNRRLWNSRLHILSTIQDEYITTYELLFDVLMMRNARWKHSNDDDKRKTNKTDGHPRSFMSCDLLLLKENSLVMKRNGLNFCISKTSPERFICIDAAHNRI